MSKKKKEKIVYKEKVNWRKELSLLPGYLIVTIWVLFTAVFLLWILGASLSTSREIFSGSVFKFETGLHFENYVSAWQTQNVSVFFGNFLLYAVVSCTVILPIFSLTTQWGIKGRLLLILLYIFLRVPFTTTYLLNFFATLSKTYEEAAAIDGCPPGKTFWLIMLPLVQPAIITVTIFNFLSVWNEFFMALIFASSSEMTPVGVGLLQIVNSMKYTGNYGGLFAAVVIVFLPTFLLYIFLSEKIIAGVTGGGIKG